MNGQSSNDSNNVEEEMRGRLSKLLENYKRWGDAERMEFMGISAYLLSRSSQRLELLTKRLVILTIILVTLTVALLIFTVPLSLDALSRLLAN